MELFTSDEINKKRNARNRQLSEQADKYISTVKKAIKISQSIDIDQEKVKKYKEYQIWCDDLSNKKSELLKEMKSYEIARDKAKEELFNIISRRDQLKDENMDIKEENSRLALQVQFKKELIEKQYA